MEPRHHEPFDRAPWRRLLGAGSDRPPAETDRRILEQARRGPAPRTARWWLPASLAASILLAVLIAHRQLEDTSAPPLLGESDVLPEPKSGEERAAPSEPPAELPRSQAPPAALQPAEPRRAESPPAELRAVAPAPAPAASEPAASAATGAAPRAMMSAPAVRTAEQSGVAADAAATPPTPEEWYARIEALRAAGRIAEADAELARLEAAHPGWLASHRQQKR